MKKKINGQLMLIAGLAIVLTMVLLSCVFNDLFREQVFLDLETDASLIKEAYPDAQTLTEAWRAPEEGILQQLRLTLVAPDGQVLFDSCTDTAELGNHLDRPEIAQAFAAGSGQIVRRSDTMGQSTFYYAMLLEDGTVLRLSKQAGSIWQIVAAALPLAGVLLLLLLAVCLLLAHILTRRLVQPIEEVARHLEETERKLPYPEIQPFVATIRQQHEELKKTAQLRTDFTANVSHELKTPLTSISGYAELMENGMIPAGQVPHYAGEIRRSAARLLHMINDMIELSKLDSPVTEVLFEPVDLYDAARQVVDRLQVNAAQQGVTLTLTGSAAPVCANREMMEELLVNLCDNAIRYNYSGGAVQVSVTRLKDRTVLSVQDTGIGIPKEHQARIFERFYRVDQSRSKQTGGTGLGLSIVKHIVACHKATLELNSEVGRGTEIRVTFPDEPQAD